MTITALFPGSFDPFTKGHEYIVERALQLFDNVCIAVGTNVSKKGLLSVENRIRLIKDIYASNPRVRVVSYGSLTGQFALEQGASVIVRGIRNSIDFNFEHDIEATNRILFPSITTVFLATPSEYAHLSSSVVRELLAFGRDVSEFLPGNIDIAKYL